MTNMQVRRLCTYPSNKKRKTGRIILLWSFFFSILLQLLFYEIDSGLPVVLKSFIKWHFQIETWYAVIFQEAMETATMLLNFAAKLEQTLKYLRHVVFNCGVLSQECTKQIRNAPLSDCAPILPDFCVLPGRIAAIAGGRLFGLLDSKKPCLTYAELPDLFVQEPDPLQG